MWTDSTEIYLNGDPAYRCKDCAFESSVDVVESKFKGPYGMEIFKANRLHFLEIGNIFKCPNKLCDRQDLSFQEFYSKSCCKDVIEKSSLEYNESDIVDHEYLKKITQLHKTSGVLNKNAQLEYEAAKKKLEEAEKQLKDSEETFRKIESKMVHYCSRTVNNITKGKIIDTYLAVFFIQYEGKPVEEDSRLFCQICREKYNDDDRVQCVLHCRHSACENCLNTLPAKNCPSCRNPFTDDQIIKLCY